MIYISSHHDPFINLALEQYLFKTTQIPALFLYQNNPSVIIGRAQNPWVECDINFLEQQNIPLVRRQSGGGTVFHDLGNLNFTFFCDKNNYDKTKNLQLIQSALASINAKVDINQRHDLILNNKKISGSAFRETRTHAFHHATLLVNSNLDLLRHSLKAPEFNIKSKGVPSVKSSVINLQEVYPDLTLQKVIDAISETFKKQHPAQIIFIKDDAAEIAEYKKQYQADAWRFEKTLPFTHTLSDGSILHIESGVIIKIESTDPELLKWQQQSYRQFYNSLK